ncbi:HAD family hydrolase [Dictyobacter arantiisoli]|uniref:Haloacid dehalogenase n=1 Tax=Dictyobacter arantiisoli TaxID=2014874 RepID=A0A5A5TDX1_9CHLR|nr:HAD family hydrolase [Dictyobacter arantiisoli]GCF09488.1 haloacid dehalogenase [Dictyobacter arantiisoli]
MAIKAVIFDLGGTLIDWPDWDDDICRRWALSYDYLVAKSATHGWPERSRYVESMRNAELEHWKRVNTVQTSNTPAEVLLEGFRTLKCDVGIDDLELALDGYAQAVDGWSMVFPDAASTLIELRKRGYRLGLLSNTWWAADWHNADLVLHGLNTLLDVVVYTSDLFHSKPHPEAFFKICKRLQVAPEECVMVGDRLVDDVSGALGVGMRGVWKKTDYPWPEPAHIHPTAIISTLAELLPLLDRWN